jgi:hypothetical protein
MGAEVMERQRYITLFREPGRPVDWDFYISEDLREVADVVRNLNASGVTKYSTYPIADRVEDYSTE